MSKLNYIRNLGARAKKASKTLSTLSENKKNAVILGQLYLRCH